MILEEGSLRIDFSNALTGFKFDEPDKEKPFFHGLSHCMKAVDFIVELSDSYLFVEIKDFHEPDALSENSRLNDLVKVLVIKFRDSFLYRWAQDKIDKPVKYLCLIELDNAMISHLMKELRRQLPESGPADRWQKSIVDACIVANVSRWNATFPEWQISRI